MFSVRSGGVFFLIDPHHRRGHPAELHHAKSEEERGGILIARSRFWFTIDHIEKKKSIIKKNILLEEGIACT